MSLVTGLQPGLVTGLRTGLNGYWDSYPANGAQLMSMLGLSGGTAPTGMWRSDGSQLATIEDVVASADLTGSGLEASALIGGSVATGDGSTDSITAADDSVLDPGTDSYFFLWVGVLSTVGGTRNLISKRTGSNAGLRIAVTGSAATVFAKQGATQTTQSISFSPSSSAVAIAGGIDYTEANEVWIASSVEAQARNSTTNTDLTNTGVLTVGDDGFFRAAGGVHGLWAVWKGAGGEQSANITQAALANLTSELSI